ncbi:MAG: glycosyltransferase [Betaproteobacteria bacterium]|nr:glycosyltransferase [Betaproteobacteria bacterium]
MNLETYCAVCDAVNIRWQPLPNMYSKLSRQYGHKHFGSGEMTPLFTYACPTCGASDRERFYALFLREMKRELCGHMIHFASEPALSKHIRRERYFASYRTTDMSMQGVDFHTDLQSLPFADNSFDFFICSHVLEHVPDDRRAIRELYRVTRPGGLGILMTPICLSIKTTIEDPTITDPALRWRLFGQNDHVRLYSHDDYVTRIKEGGFLLQQMTKDDFGEDIFRQLGLKSSSILYMVGKASAEPKTFPLMIPSTANNSPRGKKMPKISVILTSYNHEKFLRDAIESALSQTYRDFELIIWDDDSTDNSWSIIKQYNDSRIRAFRNEFKRYVGNSVNKAVSEIAQGEYIAVHHSDDVWAVDKLEKQVAVLDNNPEVGAVFSWVNIIDEYGNINNDAHTGSYYPHKAFRQENKTRHEWLRLFFFSGNALCHPSVLIRKQCYTDCGLYNPALWQLPDFDMWVRLCFKYEIHVLPECLVNFRWKSDNSNTSSLTQQTLNSTVFESYMVLNSYCSIADIEEFFKIFPFMEKYYPQPDADIEFALAMTAIEANASLHHRLFGLQLLHKLLSSHERAEKIRAVHNFDRTDFAAVKKERQIFAQHKPSAPPQMPESSLEKGIEALQNEDFEAAVESLSAAMVEEPDNPLPRAYLAFVSARQGLLQGAHDFITQALSLAPERVDLIAALGETLLKAGKPYESAKYLQEAVHLQPDLFAAYPALAQSLHLTGQGEEAASILKVVSDLPSVAQANIRTTLLQILAECGDLSEFTKYTLRFSEGLPDELLAARHLARFDENGKTFIETLARIQSRLEDDISSRSHDSITSHSGTQSGLIRIAFMAGDFTSRHQAEQLYALMLNLPTDRFFTILVSCYTHIPKDDKIQTCAMLADSVLNINKIDDKSAVEKILAAAPDILINMEVCSPTERLAAFLSAPVPHKLMWGDAPMPPIAPDVRTLAGSDLSIENMLPAVTLPEMGEVFNLPELPLTNDRARKMGNPPPGCPVLGCLIPAREIARNGWQLFAETLRLHKDATLVINLEELGKAAKAFISGQFSCEGVDPARLVFISARTTEELCLAWQSIDLGLLPQTNPGGLALPACLWMGRPCLAPASVLPWAQRPAALLRALGREEWIAADTRHYAELAMRLAPSGRTIIPDPALRERMKALGLTDAKAFALGFADAMTNSEPAD